LTIIYLLKILIYVKSSAAILWVIWKERNRLIFQGGSCKSLRNLSGSIIALIKYRCQLKGNNYTDARNLVIPHNTNELPLQYTTRKSKSYAYRGREMV
jgi:hypothetical protein